MPGKSISISKSSFKRRQYHTSSNDTSEILLGHYLAGLIEGDGSIIVPKTIRNQNGKNENRYFTVGIFFFLDQKKR